MTRNRYRNYLSMNAIVILAVIAAFKFIPERQSASVVASLIFFTSTLIIIAFEWRNKAHRSFSFWAALLFFLGSVLPIMALRFLNWGVEFSSLSFLGLSADNLHRYSNWIFMLLMVSLFVDAQRESRRSISSEK